MGGVGEVCAGAARTSRTGSGRVSGVVFALSAEGTRRTRRDAHVTAARRAIRARARRRARRTAARLPWIIAELDCCTAPSTRRRCRRAVRSFLRINRPLSRSAP